MNSSLNLNTELNYLGKELTGKILADSVVENFTAGTEIIGEGKYIKSVPVVLEGLVKVFTRNEDKELLLYYIKPFQTCVMCFSFGLNNQKSRAFAVAEQDTTALLVPVSKISKWITEYPQLNQLFYSQFELRYFDLLDTINQLLFDKLDKRLYDYLCAKALITRQNPLIISHREIAADLASAREVISRVMKKLEKENRVKQLKNCILVLGMGKTR